MKRFMRMVGMLMAETAVAIALLYAMLAVTGFLYYQDVIRWLETYRTITDVCGIGIILVWASLIIVTIYETVKRNVYEIGVKEI